MSSATPSSSVTKASHSICQHSAILQVFGKQRPLESFTCYGEFEEKFTLAHILEAQLPSRCLRASPTHGPARAFPLWFPFVACSVHSSLRVPGHRGRAHAGSGTGAAATRLLPAPVAWRLSGSAGVGATYGGWTCPHALPGVPG